MRPASSKRRAWNSRSASFRPAGARLTGCAGRDGAAGSGLSGVGTRSGRRGCGLRGGVAGVDRHLAAVGPGPGRQARAVIPGHGDLARPVRRRGDRRAGAGHAGHPRRRRRDLRHRSGHRQPGGLGQGHRRRQGRIGPRGLQVGRAGRRRRRDRLRCGRDRLAQGQGGCLGLLPGRRRGGLWRGFAGWERGFAGSTRDGDFASSGAASRARSRIDRLSRYWAASSARPAASASRAIAS